MWTILTLALCTVYSAQAVVVYQETGAIHIHKKSNAPLPSDYFPLLPNDVKATKTAETYLKQILPSLDTRIKKAVISIILFELNSVFSLALYNLVVRGFRRASIDNLVIRMNNSRVDFSASIPFLSVAGTVFTHGVIDDLNFTTLGNLSTFSEAIKIKGILNIQKLQLPSPSDGFVLQITDADIKIDIADNMIDYTLTEDLEDFKAILVQFMNKPMDDIIKSVSRAAVKLVNEELAKLPADTILKFLTPGWFNQNSEADQGLSAQRRTQYPNYQYLRLLSTITK